jgi:8-oxo-dGTP diphosphatase
MKDQRPKVGVGVIIREDNKILLGKRINSHGSNTWSPPGGHLEFFESPEECARREVLEETGITVKNIYPSFYTNDFYTQENKHYITLYFICDYDSGVPTVLEPTKCLEWRWFGWQELPSPLFLSFENFVKRINDHNDDAKGSLSEWQFRHPF